MRRGTVTTNWREVNVWGKVRRQSLPERVPQFLRRHLVYFSHSGQFYIELGISSDVRL